MMFGSIKLTPEYGTLSLVKRRRQIIHHYIDTDRSDGINLGKQATEISCTVLAQSDEERILLEQIFHDGAERELYFRDFFYKKVQASAECQATPVTYEAGKVWKFDVTFICLDPIPYDRESGEALY